MRFVAETEAAKLVNYSLITTVKQMGTITVTFYCEITRGKT